MEARDSEASLEQERCLSESGFGELICKYKKILLSGIKTYLTI